MTSPVVVAVYTVADVPGATAALPYVLGTQVEVTCKVTIAGTLTDAGAMTLTVRKPDGTTATPAVVHDSTGLYHAVVDTTIGVQGNWRHTWVGTSPAAGAGEKEFWVEDPALS